MFLASVPLHISQCHDNHHARNLQQSVRQGFLTERCTHKININHCCPLHQVHSWSAIGEMWFTPEVRDLFLSLTLEVRFLSDMRFMALAKPSTLEQPCLQFPCLTTKMLQSHVGSCKRQWRPCWCMILDWLASYDSHEHDWTVTLMIVIVTTANVIIVRPFPVWCVTLTDGNVPFHLGQVWPREPFRDEIR